MGRPSRLPDPVKLASAAAGTAVDTARAVIQLPQTLVQLNRSMQRLTETLDDINATARDTLHTVSEAASQVEKLAAEASPLLSGLRQTQGTVSALAGAAGLFARRQRPEVDRPTRGPVISGSVVEAETEPDPEDPER
jgi:ABC-type transporter Mla subunit MlaD